MPGNHSLRPKDTVNSPLTGNSRQHHDISQKGKAVSQTGPGSPEPEEKPTPRQVLQKFLDDHYEDKIALFSKYDRYTPGQKYICEVLVRNRLYRVPRKTHHFIGDDLDEIASKALTELTEELQVECEEDKNAMAELESYISKHYSGTDFELISDDLYVKYEEQGRDPIKEGKLAAKRYLLMLCLKPGSPEHKRCGDFCLTRAQGYNYNQAARKALELLKFKEDNDLLYMNEIKGYFKKEPVYYDKKYRKDVLTLIKKGIAVIPHACIGSTVNGVLENNSSNVSLSEVPGTPSEPNLNPVRKWLVSMASSMHSLTTSPASSSSSTLSQEISNPLTRSIASLPSFHRGSAQTSSTDLAKALQTKRRPKTIEKKDVVHAATSTSTAPIACASTAEIPGEDKGAEKHKERQSKAVIKPPQRHPRPKKFVTTETNSSRESRKSASRTRAECASNARPASPNLSHSAQPTKSSVNTVPKHRSSSPKHQGSDHNSIVQ